MHLGFAVTDKDPKKASNLKGSESEDEDKSDGKTCAYYFNILLSKSII